MALAIIIELTLFLVFPLGFWIAYKHWKKAGIASENFSRQLIYWLFCTALSVIVFFVLLFIFMVIIFFIFN